MNKKLYVSSLPFDLGQDEIEKMFGAVGEVVSVKVITDAKTGKGKGFAFVEMGSEKDAEEAVKQLNGSAVGGRNISVTEARR